MTFEEYLRIDAENFSLIKEVETSPLDYLSKRILPPSPSTAAQTVGRAGHCMALEPESFKSRFVPYEGRRDKRHKAYQEFLAAHPGAEALSVDEYTRAVAIGAAVREDAHAAELFSGADKEVTLTWTDEATGVKCKGRADSVSPAVLADLKTTATIAPKEKLYKAIETYWYFVQLAFYLDGARANGYPLPAEQAWIVFVRSSAPHHVVPVELTKQHLSEGRRVYRRWLRTIQECRAANHWPGPYTEPLTFEFSQYYGADDDTFFAGLEVVS